MARIWDFIEKTHDLASKDWWNFRGWLEKHGITFEGVYSSNLGLIESSSSRNRWDYIGNLDLTLKLDTGKAALWPGGTFFIYVFQNHGTSPTKDNLHDLHGVNDLEAFAHRFHMNEFWYEQNLFEDRFSVLIGQHDINNDFFVSEYGAMFLNTSFEFQPDVVYNIPTSTYPATGQGIRIKLSPWTFLTLMMGIYDGDPLSQQKNKSGLRWRFSEQEGFMKVYEGILHYDRKNGTFFPKASYKFGGWHHSKHFEDLTDTIVFEDETEETILDRDNSGIYWIADQMLWREKDEQGFGTFLQIGKVPKDRNTIDFHLGTGVYYKGIFPGRDDDELGVGVSYAHISKKLRFGEGSNSWNSNETVTEITYRIQVTPWFAIQPDVQIVSNVGADRTLNNRTKIVGFVRSEISF